MDPNNIATHLDTEPIPNDFVEILRPPEVLEALERSPELLNPVVWPPQILEAFECLPELPEIQELEQFRLEGP